MLTMVTVGSVVQEPLPPVSYLKVCIVHRSIGIIYAKKRVLKTRFTDPSISARVETIQTKTN